MRSTLLCVFFTLIIQRKEVRAQSDDFRPTPIPLNEWHHDRRDNHAGTLHETFRTASPPSVAAVPAHYWEDALRHSVYLTLVRDKIDQLIAKGDVISPISKPDGYDSKEIDDHDLWDKIKSAPFDRIKEEEPASFGDVTIMAKGRLLERNGGFLFAEDERTKEKCSHDDCMQDVKAFWSVKRVRQRDQEISPGKYHYELTFSVISQTPKKQRKPYENPIRTFTVKESSPAEIFETPQEYRRFPPVQAHVPRPERALWVHKNIAPSKFVGRKQYVSGLDRIFSSLFSDDDDDQSYESPPTKYKQSPYSSPSGSQYSKIGHVGIPVDHHQQIPYPYRPPPARHTLPPLQAPPINPNQYQYQDIGSVTTSKSLPYSQYSYDHRHESSQTVKTTRPAVLPTPLPPILHNEQSVENMSPMSMENSNNTFRPEAMKFHKTYNKYKTTPVKVNYFSDHVRPPVYNAPPGVFVTMDKKPFKPMPPMKLVHSKHKTNKPIDFRPSPQITDQSNDQDFFSETDFRPMTINFSDNASSEKSEDNYHSKKAENKARKPSAISKKPPKKHDTLKAQRITTAVPDIITAQSTYEEDIENLAWANILGSFAKTTPMEAQTQQISTLDTTTPMTTSTTVTQTTPKIVSTTTTEAVNETTVLTTVKPRRRTRPPQKFVKQDKIKKHKRITTTSTSTTSTIAPETTIRRRPSHDLTPQASSTPTGTLKPTSTSTSTTTSTTTTTTTKPPTTKTTTTQLPSTTTTAKPTVSTTQAKNKNRFRQSTLMLKGTSVKHDRWSASTVQKNQTTSSLTSSFLHRRKGSNFQGYISSTTPKFIDEEKEKVKESHADHKLSALNSETHSTNIETASQTNNLEDTVNQYKNNSVLPLEKSQLNQENDEEESKDHSEYIFQTSTTANDKPEEHATPKTKSKCKKKKQITTTTEDSTDIDLDISTSTALPATYATITSFKDTTTTESDILQDFFNYSFSDTEKHSKTEMQQEESSKQESYLKIDDDIEDFLGILQGKNEHKESLEDEYSDDDENDDDDDDEVDDDHENDSKSDHVDNDDSSREEEDYEESKIPSIDDDIEFNSDEDKRKTSRDLHYDSDPKDRPYSFLELMAMS